MTFQRSHANFWLKVSLDCETGHELRISSFFKHVNKYPMIKGKVNPSGAVMGKWCNQCATEHCVTPVTPTIAPSLPWISTNPIQHLTPWHSDHWDHLKKPSQSGSLLDCIPVISCTSLFAYFFLCCLGSLTYSTCSPFSIQPFQYMLVICFML